MRQLLKPQSLMLFALFAASSLSACVPAVIGGAAVGGNVGMQDRSIGRTLDDTVIRTKIANRFAQNDMGNLLTNVGVEVKAGTVILTGIVRSQDSATDAVKLCWQVNGVREVINEIQVSEQNRLQDAAKDTWITTQVETRLLAEKGLRSTNYSVETVNGIVYLMGLGQNQLEIDKAVNVASRVVGVKQVVSHVRLKDDPRITGQVVN